jgi:hypothetical protein
MLHRLVIRTMLKHAVDGNYDLLTWSTGADRAAKWGSERVEWRKINATIEDVGNAFVVHGVIGADQAEVGYPTRREAEVAMKNAEGGWTVAGTEQSGGTHAGRLNPAELKLVSEWTDIGAQYFNDPFAAPLD